jgi:hypothetical protein
MKIEFIKRFTFIAVVLLAACLYAEASVSSFTNRMFYNAAVSSMGTTKSIDFSQRDNALPITNPGNDAQFNSLYLKGAEFQMGRSYYNMFLYAFPSTKIRVNLPANTYAFGVDLTRFYAGNGNFSITLSTGDTYELPGKPGVSYFSSPPNPNFLGLTSDEPMKWVEYSFNNDYMVLDNFTYTVHTPNQLSGLVSYWSAENASVDVKDGNDGILRGGIAFSPGAVGQAFDLNGITRYVEVPDSANLSLTGPMTLEARIKLNTNSVQQAIVEKYDVPGLNGYLLRIVDGKLQAAMCNSNLNGAQQPASGATTVTTGVWHHVAAVYDGTTIKIYLDGVLDGSVTANYAPTNGASSLKIGARGDDANTRLNGLIDDVRIYNRALSEGEIQSVMVYDSTPPVISPLVTGNLGSNDWYRSNVQINWNVSDAESAVNSSNGCDVSNVTEDTAGVTFTCIATSLGGTSTQSVTIKRDATAPNLIKSVTVNGNPYGGGWTNQNVLVNFNCSDALSGMASQTETTTVSTEGANQSVDGFCTDAAGNMSVDTVSNINIDKSAPLINCGAADGAWHSANVSIACTSFDSVSTLANPADANFNLVTNVAAGTETANASTDSRQVCDKTGNCSTSGSVGGNKVDRKAPSVTIAAPTAGIYPLNQIVTVTYSCMDGGSGVESCTGTSPNSSLLTTSSAGVRTFTVLAADNVGNTATPNNVVYTVGYEIGILYDQTKVHKAGTAVPIKMRILDAEGTNVSTAIEVVHAVSVSQISSQTSPSLDDSGSSNSDLDFRYDQSLGGYIFNLKTTGFGTGTYQLNFTVGASPTVYSVRFQVRQ